MENKGLILSCWSNANDIAGRIVVIDAIRAAGDRMCAGGNDEGKARSKLSIDIVGTAVSVIGLGREMRVQGELS